MDNEYGAPEKLMITESKALVSSDDPWTAPRGQRKRGGALWWRGVPNWQGSALGRRWSCDIDSVIAWWSVHQLGPDASKRSYSARYM